MNNQEALKITPGQKIKVSDGLYQCDVIEPVVRVENAPPHTILCIYIQSGKILQGMMKG